MLRYTHTRGWRGSYPISWWSFRTASLAMTISGRLREI
jgi:hypothetical protein